MKTVFRIRICYYADPDADPDADPNGERGGWKPKNTNKFTKNGPVSYKFK